MRRFCIVSHLYIYGHVSKYRRYDLLRIRTIKTIMRSATYGTKKKTAIFLKKILAIKLAILYLVLWNIFFLLLLLKITIIVYIVGCIYMIHIIFKYMYIFSSTSYHYILILYIVIRLVIVIVIIKCITSTEEITAKNNTGNSSLIV